MPDTQDAPALGLALLEEENNPVILAYRLLQPRPGLYRSTDGGKTWKKLWTEMGYLILKLAIASNNSDIFYAVDQNNQVFQSQDGGNTWKELS